MLQRLLSRISQIRLNEEGFRSLSSRMREVLHPQDEVQLIGRVIGPTDKAGRFLVATQHKLRLVEEAGLVKAQMHTVRIFQRDEMVDFELRKLSSETLELSFGERNVETLVLAFPCLSPDGEVGLEAIRGLLLRWQMMK